MDREIENESGDSDLDGSSESPFNFHAVGIGASAGGLAALELLVGSLPTNANAAYIVVQHLSPKFESQMASLLGAKTSMRVTQAVNNERLEPNRIYVIPSGKEMIVSGRRLLLTDRNADERLILPIDRFLRSLANDFGRASIAVILTGLGKDGSRGIVSVNEAGGLVIAQTSESAAHPSMPSSAVETGAVHVVLSPDAMGSVIERCIADSTIPAKMAYEDSLLETTSEHEQVLRMLQSKFQIDFTQYKPATINRRIQRRMQLSRCRSLADYAERLRGDETELSRLHRDLLIGVTQFFRDGEAFDILRKKVIAPLIRQHEGQRAIRVWTPGCASGEEAYSLGMLFKEEMRVQGKSVRIKIFATDVHPESIKQAGKGSYSTDSMRNVPDVLRDRYFTELPKSGRYVVSPDLRHTIVFAVHDLLNDPPFTRIDLVVCRNLLIYFAIAAQRKCVSLFHFALTLQGVLFLGPSESLGEIEDEFDSIDRSWRIFRKRRDIRLAATERVARPTVIPAFEPDSLVPMKVATGSKIASSNIGNASGEEASLEQHLHFQNRLIQRFMPAGFLIDEQFNLIRTFGGAERYLHVPEGRHSDQLTNLLPDELSGLLSGALRRALADRKHVSFDNVAVGGLEHRVRMTVEPISFSEDQDRLVVTVSPETYVSRFASDIVATDRSESSVPSVYHVATLESELQSTRENLNATVEELETSNEELQAANEELVASNEEMQSTNEELQSVNEELHSLNIEHQRKIDELTEISSDIENLFHAIDVGVLFLDADLLIRRITPTVTNVFNILPRDIGRDIQRFSHSLKQVDLVQILNQVLKSGSAFESEVRDAQSNPWLLRVLPYVTHRESDRQLEGLVIILIDIVASAKQKQELIRYADIVENCDEAIIVKSTDGVITHWNRGAIRMYGYAAEEAIGKHVGLIVLSEKTAELNAQLDIVRRGKAVSIDTVRIARSGRVLNVRLSMSPVFDSERKVVAISSVEHDYTQRAAAESNLKIFKRAVDACRVGIVISDATEEDLPISYVNQGFIEMTGFDEDEVVGRNCRLLQGTDTDRQKVDRLRAAIRDGRDCSVSLLNYRKDGSSFWNELNISPIFSTENKLTHFIGIQQDITHKVNFESELASAKLEVAKASDEKALLLSKVSSKLEKLMSRLPFWSSGTEHSVDSDCSAIAQKRIAKQAHQILQLMGAILQQLDSNESPFGAESGILSLNAVVKECIDEIRASCDLPNMDFDFEALEESQLEIGFDRHLFKLLLKNMLGFLVARAPSDSHQMCISVDVVGSGKAEWQGEPSRSLLQIELAESDLLTPLDSDNFLNVDYEADEFLVLAVCKDSAEFFGGTLTAKLDASQRLAIEFLVPVKFPSN